MKRNITTIAVFLLAALIPVSGFGAGGQGMGISAGHDLDMLWAGATDAFDLSGNDAVYLLDSRRVTVLGNGRTRTVFHSVVWIGTEAGIRAYADLRIPWNSEFSSFEATVLRTWRDGRWWPDEKEVSPTAVVETLPFAIALADDYASARETMLLHDGVGLPCILETEYVIEDKAAQAGGTDGFHILACREPAVLCEYILEIPAGVRLMFDSGGGLGDPEITGAGGEVARRYRWKVEKSGGLGFPAPASPGLHAPSLSWSTWENWEAPGSFLAAKFDEAAVLDSSLADTLASRLRGERSDAAKARQISELVREYTRPVHYDFRFWIFSPRTASRVFETAYGHALDRAVLAAAMLRAAGLDAQPVLHSTLGAGNSDAPGFSPYDGIMLCVTGDMFHALYDPGTGYLTDGPGILFGGAVWKPSSGKGPEQKPGTDEAGIGSRYELSLTIEPGGGNAWKGRGYCRADGIFSPRNEMAGSGGAAASHMERVAGSVLSGASVTGCDIEVLETARVDAGFEFTKDMAGRDQAGRTMLMIGDPAGGLFSRLPGDIHLFQESRTSAAFIKGKMTQRVMIRLRTEGRKIAYVPRPRSIENEAGSFTLVISAEDGWLTVDRTLTLSGGAAGPGAWPSLRALLLEEKARENRTILLE